MTVWQGSMVIKLLLLIAKILILTNPKKIQEVAIKDWNDMYEEAKGG